MGWQVEALGRLADSAAGGLIVLVVGSLAARLCRQPVRRVRVVVLTLLGAAAVPCLGALPVAPRWSAGLLPAPAPIGPRVDVRSSSATSSPVHRPEEVRPRVAGEFHEIPTGSERRIAAGSPPVPLAPSSAQVWRVPPVRTWLLGGYFALAAGFAAWWCVGQVVLWRVTRAARPVPAAVREAFLDLTGPAGERVVLLASDRIALPFTYTWLRAVILLPAALCDGSEPESLRYVLAHEWSHVERRDAWTWNLANLGGLILFYQPLFWWLRRQLRLCQDFLADARAADAGSAEDYAAFLVRLARIRRTDPAIPALGIVDRRSNLTRRVIMLVQSQAPLERRCRAAWSFCAVSAAAAVIVVASGIRLSAAAPPDDKTPTQEVARPPADSKPAGETLHYSGTVVNKDTDKPVAGAVVTVRRAIVRSILERVLQETRHTTDADGKYSFTIPPEQVAEPRLYIELDVEHPDFATRAGFGYSLSMTRQNEKLNERPFFERIELRPAKPITGRVETPEGEPASGVELLAYSRTDKRADGHFEYGSFARTKTDPGGRFRLPITTPGQGVYWVLPEKYAPELHVLADGKRGDVGTITLKNGVTVTGRAYDVQGKPLAGMFVEIDRARGSTPEAEVLNQLNVSDSIERTAETDAEGRFTFGPLPPGSYQVMPTEHRRVGDGPAKWERRDVPGVFSSRKLTIKEGEVPSPFEIRASPSVVIEGQWLDSKGQPKGGWSSSVFGRIDGSSWFGQTHTDPKGRFSMQVPHGLEEVQLDISTNEHASTRHRIGKDGPLVEGRTVKLGTLDHDVKGIEIVRYVAPIILINATTKDGQPVKGFKAKVAYTSHDADSRDSISVVGGERTEAIQDEQYDGRYRTSQLVPDREVVVTVSAKGFAEASRKLTLPEGKTEEVTFVLEPK